MVTQHFENDLLFEVSLGSFEVSLHKVVGVCVGHQTAEAVLVGYKVAQQNEQKVLTAELLEHVLHQLAALRRLHEVLEVVWRAQR